jgi:hypothetical protein
VVLNLLTTACGLAAAFVLLAASYSKLTARDSTVKARLVAAGLSASLAPGPSVLAAAEGLLALGFVLGTGRWPSLGVLTLVGLGSLLPRVAGAGCGCFGTGGEDDRGRAAAGYLALLAFPGAFAGTGVAQAGRPAAAAVLAVVMVLGYAALSAPFRQAVRSAWLQLCWARERVRHPTRTAVLRSSGPWRDAAPRTGAVVDAFRDGEASVFAFRSRRCAQCVAVVVLPTKSEPARVAVSRLAG